MYIAIDIGGTKTEIGIFGSQELSSQNAIESFHTDQSYEKTKNQILTFFMNPSHLDDLIAVNIEDHNNSINRNSNEKDANDSNTDAHRQSISPHSPFELHFHPKFQCSGEPSLSLSLSPSSFLPLSPHDDLHPYVRPHSVMISI